MRRWGREGPPLVEVGVITSISRRQQLRPDHIHDKLSTSDLESLSTWRLKEGRA